jgi:aminoglycoside phosphotransferase (APT) family kinase protein
MHGDLTPWNLRRVAGRVWLLDWEAAGWGPPGADLVLWHAAAAAVRGGRGRPSPFGEAVAFWRGVVSGRGSSPRDRRLSEALDRALAGMAGEAT